MDPLATSVTSLAPKQLVDCVAYFKWTQMARFPLIVEKSFSLWTKSNKQNAIELLRDTTGIGELEMIGLCGIQWKIQTKSDGPREEALCVTLWIWH